MQHNNYYMLFHWRYNKVGALFSESSYTISKAHVVEGNFLKSFVSDKLCNMYLVRTDFSAMPYKVRMYIHNRCGKHIQVFMIVYRLALEVVLSVCSSASGDPPRSLHVHYSKIDNEAPKLGMMMTGNFDAILSEMPSSFRKQEVS